VGLRLRKCGARFAVPSYAKHLLTTPTMRDDVERNICYGWRRNGEEKGSRASEAAVLALRSVDVVLVYRLCLAADVVI